MLKHILKITGLCLLGWMAFSCDETDAGLLSVPSEIIEDVIKTDTTVVDTTDLGEEAAFGVPCKQIRTVPMPNDSYWTTIREWPGIPGDSTIEKRWDSVRVSIDAVFSKRDSRDRFSTIFNTWFSTGLYAAPAEIITVHRPESLKGRKLWVRIGASTCVLSDKHQPWKRLPVTYVQKELNEDTTQVFNYNGGNVYIVTNDPFTQPETFMFDGVLKSPDFVLGKTDARKWMEEIQRTTIPMAEIAGKRVIWTMPTSRDYLRNVQDPVALMEFYDDAIENDYFVFHGISESSFNPLHRAPTVPQRLVPDPQTCAGAAHSGNPAMFGMNYASRGVQLEMMKTTNNAWGFYHEVGHNYQVYTWKWSDGPGSIGEVSNNFHIMHARNRMYGRWHEGTDVYQAKIDAFMKDAVEDRNYESSDESKVDGTTRLIPFCQLAQQYGWKLFAYLGKKSRELPNNVASVLSGSPKEGRKDFFCISCCEYAGVDLSDFFDAWGLKRSERAKLVISNAVAAGTIKAKSTITNKFWEKWEDNLIPELYKERTPCKFDDLRYDLKAGEIDRQNWEVDQEECQYAISGTEHPITALIDGSGSTYWVSESVNRLDYSKKQPMVAFDMKAEQSFNYVEIQHYPVNGSYYISCCKRFLLECKHSDAAWETIGEFETSQTKDLQRFVFDKTYTGEFIRLTCLENFTTGGGNTTGGIMMAEIKIGQEN